MTVHIAISNNEGAIILSDSQGSTSSSESHGNQKQYVGDNFIVGGAGHGGIIDRLFQSLHQKSNLKSVDAADAIEAFFEKEVRREQFCSSSILLVLPGQPPESEKKVLAYNPGTFVHFDPPSSCAAIGSGCEFVGRAWRNRGVLGIEFPSESLADLTVEAVFCANAADESLTVDDLLLVSFLKNGKAYSMGDGELRLRYAPDEIKNKWRTEINAKWGEIKGIATSINDEIREAVRLFSVIRAGQLQPSMTPQFISTSRTVDRKRGELDTKLMEYFVWYDQQLGR